MGKLNKKLKPGDITIIASEKSPIIPTKHTNTLGVKFIPLVKRTKSFLFDNNNDVNTLEYTEFGYRKNTRLYIPEWDFDVIRVMYDTDSYFRRSVDKYVELVLGNDVEFVSLNQNAKAYIEAKFRHFCNNIDMSLDEFVESILRELILYANSFVVKLYKTIRKERVHVGYKVLTTPDVKLEWNFKSKKITGIWDYSESTADPDLYVIKDVLHLKIFKHAKYFFGKPFVIPVLDDIRALRKLEEIMERDAFTYGHRFIHCKLSTEEQSVYDTDIDRIASDIDAVSEDGIFISSDKIEFEPVRIEDSGVPINKYIEYFRNRVFAGLGTSSVGMGIDGGANRGTAITLDKQTENMAKIFSSGLNREFKFHIVRNLLSVSGMYQWKRENYVQLKLPPINIDEKIKVENHAAQMYAQHLITETEARLNYMEMSPLIKSDRKDMYVDLIEKPLGVIQALAHPTTSAKNSGSNKDQPANQYGKKIAPTRPVNDNSELFKVISYQIVRLVRDNRELNNSLIDYFASYLYERYGSSGGSFEIFSTFTRKLLSDILELAKQNKELFSRDYLLSVVQGVILSKAYDISVFIKSVGGTYVE
jgi:hypothetical protein